MKAQALTKIEWIVGGLAAFLVIDLLVFPWVDVSIGPIDFTSSGTGAPDGALGVIGMLAALAFAVDLGIQKFASMELPMLGGSRERTRLIFAAVATGCIWLKFLLHVSHTGDLGYGAWLALVASVGLVVLLVRPDLVR